METGQLSHPYMTTRKPIALTRWTFVGKVMPLLFYTLSRLAIAFLPRNKWKRSKSLACLYLLTQMSHNSPFPCPFTFYPHTGPEYFPWTAVTSWLVPLPQLLLLPDPAPNSHLTIQFLSGLKISWRPHHCSLCKRHSSGHLIPSRIWPQSSEYFSIIPYKASPAQRTWVWVNSGSWWWTGKPGGLQSMGLQRVRHDWTTSLSHFHCPCWFLTQVSSMTSKLFFGFYLQVPLSHSPQLLFQTLEFSLNFLSLKISSWSVSGRHGWLVTILVMSYNCFKLEKLTLI